MTDKNDLPRAAEKNGPPPPQEDPKDDVAAMNAALAGTLSASPEESEALLLEQAQALNGLFNRLLEKVFQGKDVYGDALPDYVNSARIALALRAQHQCCATVKAKSAVRYMSALSTASPPAYMHDAFRPPACGHDVSNKRPPPPTVKNDEQTGLGKSDP